MIFGAAAFAISIVNSLVALALAWSVTWIVKEYVPAVVGVPLKVPFESSVRPGGRTDAWVTDHAYGEVPPDAVKDGREYGTLTCPDGSGLAVVMVNGAVVIAPIANAGTVMGLAANRGAGAVALARLRVLSGPNRPAALTVPAAGSVGVEI